LVTRSRSRLPLRVSRIATLRALAFEKRLLPVAINVRLGTTCQDILTLPALGAWKPTV
jgi:hypothetical protein